jgi:diguanylate cyclase (GGDEF)-like protein
MFPLLVAVALAVVAVLYAFRDRRLREYEQQLRTLVDERNTELLELTRQLQVANAALQEMATVDALTGLANRRRFDVFLQQEWQRSGRTRQPLSVLLLDVDHFKKFNDRYGHPAGDECLRSVAQVIGATVHRATDLCCRYGGEEFAVVMTDTPADGALRIAESIRSAVERLRLPHADAPEGYVTVSIGVATREGQNYETAKDLIAACDRALYQVKEDGRNDALADAVAAV